MSNNLYLSPRTIQHLRRIQSLLEQLHPAGEPQAMIVPGSPEPRDGVIVFTGSFNPPTTAHVALLRQAWQYAHEHKPMHVYAAMSRRTVDKESVERPLLIDRIMLLEKVLRRRIPDTGIMLFNRGLYVEQAEGIRRSFPKVRRILFLIGFDKIVQILDPHYYENREAALDELFGMAELLVAPRGKDGEDELEALLAKLENRRFTRYIHPLPFNKVYRDVSSTSVRQQARGYEREVPQEVQRFMHETRAYAPPLQRDGTQIDHYGERVKQLNRLLGIMAI